MAMAMPQGPNDAIEWSRYMAALFLAQNDREGSLQRFHYFIPHFVLQTFCTADRLKVNQSGGGYYGEDSSNDEVDTLVIYDPKSMRFDKRHWSECFGESNIYERYFDNFKPSTWQREQWRPFETLQRLDAAIFSALDEPVWQIYHHYQSGSKKIPIQRGDLNSIRKFMFLMTSLRNRDRNQHLLAKDPTMDDARARRKKFMEMHMLDHPRDLWLQNAEFILDTHHYDIAMEINIFDLDREDYRTNARERFVVFWEAGPGEEFVLTDNAFGCFEGGGLGARKKLTIQMTAREHEQRIYTRDFMWHQLFVLSPKLVMALCHGTLSHPSLTKAQRRRLGLRRSLLEGLPHPIANNYYKDLTKTEVGFLKQGWEIPPEVEKLFGNPRWDGKVIAIEHREQDELVFPISLLTAQQVSLVNCVLLHNQASAASPVQSVSFRPPTSYRSLHDSLVEFENINWSKYTEEKQNTYAALQKRLHQYLTKIEDTRSVGSTPSARPNLTILTPPTLTPEPNPMFSRKPEQPAKAETVMTTTTSTGTTEPPKKTRRGSVAPQDHPRFEHSLPTPPVTQPHSRESSMAPPQVPAHHNQRTPTNSMPPSARTASSERPQPVTDRSLPTPQRSRAPSSDRATTMEVPTRRATVTAQALPESIQNEQGKRPQSTERRYSVHDGMRVDPSPGPAMPEIKREPASRGHSTGPAVAVPLVRAVEPPIQTSVSTPTGSQRRYSVVNPPALAVPNTAAPDTRRPPSMERRQASVDAAQRAESANRALMEKRYLAQGTQLPPRDPQPASIPVPEPKPFEPRNIASEKAESRYTSPSPARPTSQTVSSSTATGTATTAETTRMENPKLGREQLEHIEKQRRLEQQRLEQERIAEQQKAEQERLKAEQERLNQQRAEQERREREELRRIEQQRLERAEQQRVQEQQRRLEQQRIEDQRRAEQLRLEQIRQEKLRMEQLEQHRRAVAAAAEQERRENERREQERQNMEQARFEQQQLHQLAQQRAAQQHRQEAYNRSRERERSLSSHSDQRIEPFRVDQSRFDNTALERQARLSEISVDSTESNCSSDSSGSSGSGSSSRDSEATEKPLTIRGGNASPPKRALEPVPFSKALTGNGLTQPKNQLKFLQILCDEPSSVCDAAESMIVEVDEDDEGWVDEGFAESQQQGLELLPKPRSKPVVRFATPKPKRSDSQSPTVRKASIMGLNNKVRYAGHVQHAHGSAQHNMHTSGHGYGSHRDYQ